MLLSRREAATITERVRLVFWPRVSWSRSIRYTRLRLERLPATRHAIALGLAIGVFAAFQPILGFQMLFAGALAWTLRASIPAALLGTFVGTPATWPLMWLASYELGALILGAEYGVTMAELWNVLIGPGAKAGPDLLDPASSKLFWKVLQPLAVGAVPLGLIAGAGFYALVNRSVEPRRRTA